MISREEFFSYCREIFELTKLIQGMPDNPVIRAPYEARLAQLKILAKS